MTLTTLTLQQTAAFVAACVRGSVTPLLWGAPGVAKTSIVRAVAACLKLPAIIMVASNYEAVDIAGMPAVVNGVVTRTPFAALREAVDHPRLLVLDDVTAIPRSIEPVLLRLILERVVGDDLKLHPDTRVVCVANPSAYAPSGIEFSAAALNRMAQCQVEPSVEEVAAWFAGEPVDLTAACAAPVNHDMAAQRAEWGLTFALATKTEDLIQFTPPPASVEGGAPWASPRGWALCFDAVSGLGASPLDKGARGTVARALMDGTVGEAMATRLVAMLREAAYLPTVEEIVKSPTTATVPTERKRQIAAIGHAMRVAKASIEAAWLYTDRLDDEIKAVCTRILPSPVVGNFSPEILAHYTRRQASLAVAAGLVK